MRVLIVYYSRTGNTKKMAKIIADSIKEEGLETILKEAERTSPQELLEYQGIIMGTPVYYGSMAHPLKKLLDESVRFHGELEGKIGGAFSSSANVGGGNETAVLDILKAMLIHGMIVQGDSRGDHYGPVSIGVPDRRAERECKRFGKRVAHLIKLVFNK